MENRKRHVKLLVKPVKSKRHKYPSWMRRSARKVDLPPGWFQWLGFLTHMVAIEFDFRADVEFQETRFAYFITVRRTEEAK